MKDNLEVIICKLKPDWYTYDAEYVCLFEAIPKDQLDKTYTLKGHTDKMDNMFLEDKHTSPFNHLKDGRPIVYFSLHHFDIILRKPYVKEISNPA